MSPDPGQRDVKSLIAQALAGPATPAPAAAPADAPPPDPPPAPESTASADTDREAAELIEIYFALEEPHERDALFDRLVSLPSPLVTDFLRVMLDEDEDEYLRAAAAAELARRGVPDGLEALTADLDDPEEPFFFTHAVQVLGEVLGSSFYETLATLWRDPNRDEDQRREAMLGLESVDPARALDDFVAFITGLGDLEALPDDQLEVAILALVRHRHVAGRAALAALRQRIAGAQLDADERSELLGMIDEGLALLDDA